MPWTVNPDHGYLEQYSTGESIDAFLAINVDAATAPGTDPVLPDASGEVTITGGQVASGTTSNVIRTHSTAASQFVVEVQQSGSAASSTSSLNGVSHFDSGAFTVSSGFVSLSGTAVGRTITGNSGGALSPTAGNWNILAAAVAAGTSPITTSGAASTLTINAQRAQAIAATNASNVGLAAFNSADFSVDANAFVSASGTGIVKTLTGTTSGGARPPTAGNINIAGSHGLNATGAVSTITVAVNNTLTLGDLTPLGAGVNALTLTTGDLNIAAGNLEMPTTSSSTVGVYTYNAVRFLHAFGTTNCFLGTESGNFTMSGQGNTGLGHSTVPAITSGNRNLGAGPGALLLLTSGSDNVAVGNAALDTITTSSNNVAIGSFALTNCTTSNNTAVGQQAGANLASNGAMTAIGYSSLNLATGDRNTAVGHTSLDAVTSGERNTAIGALAGTNVVTGSNNILMGHNVASAYTGSEGSNIVVGHAGVAAESNTIRIGTNGSSTAQQNRAFVAGITAVTVSASAPVGVDTNSQLSSLGFGTALQVFTSNGAGVSPSWQAPVTNTVGNSAIASGSAISLTTATNANVTSISLAAGTWLVSAICMFGGTPVVSGPQQASISTTSVTHTNLGDNSVQAAWLTSPFAAGNCPITIPGYQLVLGGTTTVYLVASGVFSGGTMTAYGRISAVKIV